MKKEIGSEFWNIPTTSSPNNIFPSTTLWFISGRSALLFIIEEILQNFTMRNVALPSWCCESMIKPFVEKNISINFYSVFVDSKGNFVQDLSNVNEYDAVLLMDYFGYACDDNLENYRGVVIRDITHSIFSNKINKADYYYGSLRKWAGFLTGGFAWSSNKKAMSNQSIMEVNLEYVSLRKEAMSRKKKYIENCSDKKDYLPLYHEAEIILDNYEIISALPADVEQASKLDIALIREVRKRNAKFLLNSFSDVAFFPEIKADDCPLFVPIFVPFSLRDELVEYLNEQNIFCPIHWPISRFHVLGKQEKMIYDNELSLVCDQRYSLEDMERMCEAIKTFLKKERNA